MAQIARLSVKKPEAKRENQASHTQKKSPSQSIRSPVEQILFLQRTIGNRAAGKLIESGALQAKLRIGRPGDIYEQEADRVTEQVMRMPDVSGQTKDIEANINALRSGGQPLPESVRSFFEPRFGHDFSKVRVHSGADAGQSARDVDAKAYTVGQNIVFGAGQYAPNVNEGQQLIAHELTHVVQQQAAPIRLVMRQPDKKEKSNGSIIDEIKKNPLFKKLPKSAQDKIIEELESVPEKIVQEVAEQIIDALNIDDEMKEGLKKVVEGIIEKLKGKPKKFSPCDVLGFHPAGSSQFKGMCCTESIENEKVCCPPERMATTEQRCCPKGTLVFEGKCINPNDLPPLPKKVCPDGRQPTFRGECCTPDQINIGTSCVDKPVIPPPPQPVLTIEKASVITFKKDAPQPWFHPSASFSASLTTEGKAVFADLLTFMKQNPAVNIQLQGHASSEKPKGDPNYNQRLTDRRVKLIASELQKKGIDSNRLKNIPDDDSSRAGCTELSAGMLSCGDVQAQPGVEASDRNVSIKAFQVK